MCLFYRGTSMSLNCIFRRKKARPLKLIKKQTFLYAFIFFRLYLPQQNILKYGELKHITAAIIEMLYAIYKPIKQSALFMVKL